MGSTPVLKWGQHLGWLNLGGDGGGSVVVGLQTIDSYLIGHKNGDAKCINDNLKGCDVNNSLNHDASDG